MLCYGIQTVQSCIYFMLFVHKQIKKHPQIIREENPSEDTTSANKNCT